MRPRETRQPLPDVPSWWDVVLVALGLVSTVLLAWGLAVTWTGGALPATSWRLGSNPLLVLGAFLVLAPVHGVVTYVVARLLTVAVWAGRRADTGRSS